MLEVISIFEGICFDTKACALVIGIIGIAHDPLLEVASIFEGFCFDAKA